MRMDQTAQKSKKANEAGELVHQPSVKSTTKDLLVYILVE